MESNSERGARLRDALASATAPTTLTAENQRLLASEEIGPQWVDVPFKRPMRVVWDWGALLLSATARSKDLRLAIIGLVMSWACEMSSLTIESLLQTLGFEHVWSSNYPLTTVRRNAVSEPARTFAHRAVEWEGRVYHAICAVFKGTTTVPDIITDVKSAGDGFLEAGTSCANALATYVEAIEGADDTNTILFITGHSLGAAVANVVGRLTKDIAEDGMRFVYTYASPNYACGDDAASGYAFPNFRTFTNVADAVPTVPPAFPKIGLEYTYDLAALDDGQRRRFDAAYKYFRGTRFEDDDDPLGLGVTRVIDPTINEVLRNHLAATYMSFIVSELSDDQVDLGESDSEEA